jgi:hypothetical protein
MPIDVDSLAVAAVSGKIWNVVAPVELSNLANHGVERAIHHEADKYHSGTRSFFGLARFADIDFPSLWWLTKSAKWSVEA